MLEAPSEAPVIRFSFLLHYVLVGIPGVKPPFVNQEILKLYGPRPPADLFDSPGRSASGQWGKIKHLHSDLRPRLILRSESCLLARVRFWAYSGI